MPWVFKKCTQLVAPYLSANVRVPQNAKQCKECTQYARARAHSLVLGIWETQCRCVSSQLKHLVRNESLHIQSSTPSKFKVCFLKDSIRNRKL
mmetsp:Transcript_17836/g.60835  ORF Transcript_17836/g.60835 Transcript_17836/m.60835 type:complete len:93 (-) Transcript_17836:91-369(-)